MSTRVKKSFKHKDTYNYVRVKERPKKSRFVSNIEYDFLTNIKTVFRWASDNYKLTRSEIELMLYLYGQGVFTSQQARNAVKLYDINSTVVFNNYIKSGWFLLWREKQGRDLALYTLSNRGKTMCARMHKFCCGVEKIPESPRSNVMAINADKGNAKTYLDMIKRMNEAVSKD